MTARKATPVVAPHVFLLDPDTPGDPYTGLGVCKACRLPGKPEDAHHTLPDVPEQAEHRHRIGDDD